jgi:hypothetical protein
MDSKILVIGLLVAGAVVLVLTISAFPHGGQTGFAHEVSETAESDLHPSQKLTPFARLSTEAQHAFLTALRSDDGTYVVYDERKIASEFSYGDVGEVVYVRYEDSVYVMETNGRSGIGALDQILFYGGVFVSAGFLLGGIFIGITGWKSQVAQP